MAKSIKWQKNIKVFINHDDKGFEQLSTQETVWKMQLKIDQPIKNWNKSDKEQNDESGENYIPTKIRKQHRLMLRIWSRIWKWREDSQLVHKLIMRKLYT